MHDTVNQHYVPQGHLRLFANRKKRLWVYDKHKDKVFGAAVRDLASERYFNEYLPDDPQHFQKGEQYLQKVEDLGLPLIERVVNQIATASGSGTGTVVLTNKERSSLSYYLAVQMQRTKESRKEVEELMNKLATALSRSLAPPPPVGFKVEQLHVKATKDFVRFAHLQSIAKHANPLSRMLSDLVWIFRKNLTDQRLWLSDQPFARHSAFEQARSSGRGLLSPGVQIRFPLSPGSELMIIDSEMHCQSRILDGAVFEMTADDVRESNAIQVEHSYRFLFGGDARFDAARELCESKPNLRDLERERFSPEWVNTEMFVNRILKNLGERG